MDVNAKVNGRQRMMAFMGEYFNDLPKSGWRSELVVEDGVLFHLNYHLHASGGVEWGENDKEQWEINTC